MSAGDSQRISGEIFADALISGIHRVIGQQEFLNRINVFPVADSDTGTNLSLSLSAALPVLSRRNHKHLGGMLATLADALLDGARGNSGAIVAQFFQGLSDATGEATHFTTRSFAAASRNAAEYARDALSKPREGTILSAIGAFAISVESQLGRTPDLPFDTLLATAREHVDDAVAKTPGQLDVLRKAGVVDAGAKGFAELVGGVSDFLEDGEITPLPETGLLDDVQSAVDFSAEDNSSTYRFCTECMINGTDIDRRKLRESLSVLGDSLVLAGTKRKAKVHIHVDDPDEVFRTARNFGELSGEKADDMHRQQHATHSQSRKFAVITDSGADINDDDLERLDIHMVPCRIQFGDRGFMDKVSISTDEFYAELKSNPHHPTTSQPAPGDFRRQFQFLASHFNDVLSINLTSMASGTYESARAAAERSNAAGRIHVVDSRNASIGQGQLVVLAAEYAEAGFGLDETLQMIREQIPLTRTFALLHDMRFAVRGGRIPQWVRTLTDLMRVTPVICTKPNGKVSLGGCLIGRRNRIRKFARFVAKYFRDEEAIDVRVGEAVCPTDADRLTDELRRLLPNIASLKTCQLGTALGVHGGPGTLLISVRPVKSAEGFSIRHN